MKTLSATNEPVSRNPKVVPIEVITGKIAFRSAYLVTSLKRGTPFAIAVRMNSCFRVSIIEARVSRVMSAVGRSESTTTGRRRYIHSGARRSDSQVVGSMSNLTAKIYTSIGARTKFGRVTPNVESVRMLRSVNFFSLRAEMVPRKIPMAEARVMARTATLAVMGTVRFSLSRTGS